MQIKLWRQVGYSIDFIYDSLTEEIIFFIRYTIIQVNNSNILMQLDYLMNCQPLNMINVNDIESITSSTSSEHLIRKIFFDSEKNRSLKVMSIINCNKVNIIECNYLTGVVLREEFSFYYNEAKGFIQQ